MKQESFKCETRKFQEVSVLTVDTRRSAPCTTFLLFELHCMLTGSLLHFTHSCLGDVAAEACCDVQVCYPQTS